MKRFAIIHEGYIPEELKRFDPNFTIDYLAFRNVKDSHFDSKEEAEDFLNIVRNDLETKLGMKNLRVKEIECYDYGESIKSVF